MSLESLALPCQKVSEDSFLALPSEVLKPILKTFYELLDKPNSEGFKLQKFEAKVLDNFNDSFKIKDTTKLKTIKEELSKPFELPKEIEGLQADLRDYQKRGCSLDAVSTALQFWWNFS